VEMPEERKTDLERELGDDFLIERDAPLDPL
jgi:hypothetical protein